MICVPSSCQLTISSPQFDHVARSTPISIDGNCGSNSDTNATCLSSTFGNCCSSKGFCGSTPAYCGAGCDSAFGTCTTTSSSQSISTSGSCGLTGTSSITCQGSTFGDCCSGLGFCGGNSSYCGNGCQSAYGTCGESSGKGDPTTSTAVPTSSSTASPGTVSIDGNCGSNSAVKATCLTSTFGDCCSPLGYCGGNSSYCGAGCQSAFGSCGEEPSSSSSPLSNNTSGSTNFSSTASPIPKPTGTFLSTGAKVGIGLGSGAAALAALGLLAWYVRGRHAPPRVRASGDAVEIGDDKADIFSTSQRSTSTTRLQARELLPPSVSLCEMDGGGREVAQGKAELPASEKGARIASVDVRLAAGYDGAYRGN